MWTSSGDRTPWLVETGKGSRPMAVQFQLRPDPLAKYVTCASFVLSSTDKTGRWRATIAKQSDGW